MDSLWGSFGHRFIEPECKAGPEEEIHCLDVVDGVGQSLEIGEIGLSTVKGSLQET